MIGIGLWNSPQATIEGNKIVKNGGYGVGLYQGPCFDTDRLFLGCVSGKQNIIPGPGNPDGNSKGAICPQKLSFLTSTEGGELDRRK